MFYPLLKKTIILSALCLLSADSWEVQAAIDSDVEFGKKSFEDNCSDCHSLGGGETVGPDLQDVLKRRPKDWIVHYISEPDELRQNKDATALELKKKYGDSEMPNLGIGHEESEAIVAFLAQTGTVAPVETTTPIQGDAIRGHQLFIGKIKFESGAPSCLGCHAVNIPEMEIGGTLGPELTALVRRLGPAGIQKAMKTLPFPSMKPIYQKRPLSESEQNDLVSFLIGASAQPQDTTKSSQNYFLFTGLMLALGLLFVFNLIWAKRRQVVSK